MKPNLQTQIFDPLTQKYVQVDGGEITTASLLFQILIELRIYNDQYQSVQKGQSIMDDLNTLRSDLLNEPGFTQQG